MVMDVRTVNVILVSSLSDAPYLFNCGKERALQELTKQYGQDFGYDQRAWFDYILENDKDFISELLDDWGDFSLEPFMYEALEKDGRFDMDKVSILPHSIEKYDKQGRLKPD